MFGHWERQKGTGRDRRELGVNGVWALGETEGNWERQKGTGRDRRELGETEGNWER